MSMNPQPNSAVAADAILALINIRPRSPTRDELVAIIERSAPTVGTAKHRGEWDVAMQACKAIENTATDEQMAAACERVDDCARRIRSEPVCGAPDILLLAEVAYWTLWTEPSGLRAPEAEANLAAGPNHHGDHCDQALVTLLRGIRAAYDGRLPRGAQ